MTDLDFLKLFFFASGMAIAAGGSIPNTQSIQRSPTIVGAESQNSNTVPTFSSAPTLASVPTNYESPSLSSYQRSSSSGLYYPDWEGGCLNDGGEPEYMSSDPEEWMYEDLSSCCRSVYFWMYDDCMQSSERVKGNASASPSSDSKLLFYPNWAGNEHVCKSDDNAPDYMKRNPTDFMTSSLEECCKKNYGWNYDECTNGGEGGSKREKNETDELNFEVNDDINATNEGDIWYADYESGLCVKSCAQGDDEQCGGLATQFDEIFDNAGECCQFQLSWMRKSLCEAISQGIVPSGTNNWYYDWTSGTCKQDCDEDDPSCGGLAAMSDNLFESKAVCCDRAPGSATCLS